jgi:predicted hydrocarbon binding protein
MTYDSSRLNSSYLGQIMLAGTQEIIGPSEVQALYDTARQSALFHGQEASMGAWGATFSEMSSIQYALEQIYGGRGGRGISQRAGRASYKYILRQYGESLGLTTLDFRLLPAPARLKTGLETLAAWFSQLSQGLIVVESGDQGWLWRTEHCPLCWQRQSDEPVCTFTVGLIQEFLAWASGGKIYSVSEVECLAVGKPACVIRIDARPFEQ